MAIERQGGMLATRENFAAIAKCKAADVFVLHTRGSFLSWMVMYYTNSVWSHTGMFTENGRIIDATTSGVVEHDFFDYFDGWSYIMVLDNVEFTDEQRLLTLSSARGDLVTNYNWPGVVRLFFYILLGLHHSYRLRYSLDILILLGIVLVFGSWFPIIVPVATTVAIAYVLTVCVNVIRRVWLDGKSAN